MLGPYFRGFEGRECFPTCLQIMFYKTTVQAMLLYGSETWNLTPSAMKNLEGFHIRSAYRMARDNKPQRNPLTMDWIYPSSKDVLEEVGLFTIKQYIEVR